MRDRTRLLADAHKGDFMDELELVADFVNTSDRRSFRTRGAFHSGGDELASAAGLAGWMVEHDLALPGVEVGGRDLAVARALRDGLRSLAERNAGLFPEQPVVLPPLRLALAVGAAGRPVLAPCHEGVERFLARLGRTVVEAETRGVGQRLKTCGCEDCQWVFVDRSRNGLGRWCSMRVCGNRIKTRAYRRRAAATRPPGRARRGRVSSRKPIATR